MKNRYFIRSRISEKKFREIIKLFSVDLTALQIASLTKINRNTINSILKKIREKIAQNCERQNSFNKKEPELNEVYVGTRCIPGEKNKGKVIMFGLKKRSGEVYTQIIKNCSKETLFSFIKEKLSLPPVIYMDGFKRYDNFVNMAYKKFYRFYHSNNKLAVEIGIKNNITNHINGVKNFWGITKMRLSKFRGINKQTFYLHLKECEFRFNNRGKDLYKILLDILRKEPLN